MKTAVQEVPLSGVEIRVKIFNDLLRESRSDIYGIAMLVAAAAKSGGQKRLEHPEEAANCLRTLQDGSFAAGVNEPEWNLISSCLASAVQRAMDQSRRSLDESDEAGVLHHCALLFKGCLILCGHTRTRIASQVATSVNGFGMKQSPEATEKMLTSLSSEKSMPNTLQWRCVVTSMVLPAIGFLQRVLKQQQPPPEQVSAAVSGAIEITGGELKTVAQRVSLLSRAFLSGYDSDAEAGKAIDSTISGQRALNGYDWLIFKTALLQPVLEVLQKEVVRIFGESEAKLLNQRWGLV